MDCRNIYDMFRENVELKKLIDRYHRVLKEKDKTIKNQQEQIAELINQLANKIIKEKNNE